MRLENNGVATFEVSEWVTGWPEANTRSFNQAGQPMGYNPTNKS